jgi:outer membrane lipoprotein SlyB
VGLPSDLDTGPLVGSVASRQFGGPPGEKKWHLGAAGTREMQERLEQTGFEVVVKMDDGEQRAFRPRDPSRFGIGQRVSVRSGELEPI